MAPGRNVREDQPIDTLPVTAADNKSKAHQGFVSKTRDKTKALNFKEGIAQAWLDRIRHYGLAPVIGCRNVRDRRQQSRSNELLAEQQGREFTSATTAPEAGHAPLSAHAKFSKLAAVDSEFSNSLNPERRLNSRLNFSANHAAALAEWRDECAGRRPTTLSWWRSVGIRPAVPVLS